MKASKTRRQDLANETSSHSADMNKELKSHKKKKRKGLRFSRTRMWFSIFMSAINKDLGSIPKNIGNNILISNNTYVTKHALSAMFIMKEYSLDVPVNAASELVERLKHKVTGVNLNVAIITAPMKVDTKNSGLETRERAWLRTLENPEASEKLKKRCTRLLYSAEKARARITMMKTYTYFTLSAANGRDLQFAVDEFEGLMSYLNCDVKRVKADLDAYLMHSSALADKTTLPVKDIPNTVMSPQTSSEMLSTATGINERDGTLLGLNVQNMSPYTINFRATAKARNVYVGGGTGSGKTYCVMMILMDMMLDGFKAAVFDIKGEFSSLVEGLGGKVLSLRQDSQEFINTFVMNADDYYHSPELYFDELFSLSVETLTTVVNPLPEEEAMVENIMNTFLANVFLELGVLGRNPNTWYRSKVLHPHQMYDRFSKFASPAIRRKYGSICEKIGDRFEMFFREGAPYAHIFNREYNMQEVLDSKGINFDFGLQSSSTGNNAVIFKLKMAQAMLIHKKYAGYIKENKRFLLNICEESQIVSDYVLDKYKEIFVLGRSQNQVNFILGNDILTLAEKPVGMAILQNIKILIIGNQTRGGIKFICDEYSLDKYSDTLQQIAENEDYENTFLLVNKMQAKGNTALIKTFTPTGINNSKLYNKVDVEEEGA